jgi:aminoglycoside phosphotransferase (APT) family kinase protein
MEHEIQLPQGGTVVGVVRVGDTVRRPRGPRAEYARAVLGRLEERGVPAPRFLGIDGRGRDILSYIKGETGRDRTNWPDMQLSQVALLVRAMHDATSGDALAGGAEVVCHNDLAPWNLVLDGDAPIAFIDYDDAAPGARLDDLGYLLWTFLRLGDEAAPDSQAQRMAALCASYGLRSGEGLIDAILAQQARVGAWRQERARNAPGDDFRRFCAARVVEIQSNIAWVQRHRANLAAAI